MSDERGEWEETRPERKGRAECPKVQVLEDLCWSVLECPAQSQTSVPVGDGSFPVHSHCIVTGSTLLEGASLARVPPWVRRFLFLSPVQVIRVRVEIC